MGNQKASQDTIKRLFVYYRTIEESYSSNVISSEELAKLTGFPATLIRKDLSFFGEFGTPGKGYYTEKLIPHLKKILGLDRDWDVVLVGIGNLGKALLTYPKFKMHGFRINLLFDSDPDKIGKTCAGLKINDIAAIKEELAYFSNGNSKKIAILTVPAKVAQEVTNILVDAGIKAILNFAPTQLFVPQGIAVSNIDVSNEMARLTYNLNQDFLINVN